MNKRLIQFLAAENISQAQFADTIKVARASVSHIVAGRNKPGFDFIESTALHYPALNIEWLITGKGRMYKSQTAEPPEAPPSETPPAESLFEADEPTLSEPVDSEEPAADNPPPKTGRREKLSRIAGGPHALTKVIAFFDDGTFQEIQ